MQYLCDTNIISELAKGEPNPGVIEWAGTVAGCALSVITIEELHYGLSWRPNTRVQAWVEGFVRDHAEVLPVTEPIARAAGVLRGRMRAGGITRTQADMLIAATALVHGLTVVTRNGRDFEGCGVPVLDPFR
ncbi:MAG TPA: type II toxin-antitoxin system VapC family toxin [Spirochaetota bacterium]|nr:type II toxin-antitoxin system VapC family toxin [Spirochaetota bacterium]HNT12881.1 type II toxin-antitoxin system VapC family toxin [Spirochaetota bacterium]HNV47145.1 type II toxin-antitoxin system VapC family toxin [Spirochaetota bacterium]HOS40835.1 type II toxin-antitoxin system VapC family toxin [Spirochaetota bacterium]HPI22099.1 type II toxin-antitoxin system VapC family toxin [Spirochaetota bacterium]